MRQHERKLELNFILIDTPNNENGIKWCEHTILWEFEVLEDLFMSKYYSINKFSKILGVSAQTLRNWDKKGKLHPHHTSSNGYRYYSHEQLNQVMNVKPNLDRSVIGYCRVSSNKQKDDLERQIENMKLYLTAQGKHLLKI